MRKIVVVMTLILGFSSTNAQWYDYVELTGYVSVGYGYMSPSSKGLDDFTSRYNSQRKSILSKELEPVGMSGMTYNTGILAMGILMEIGYATRNGTMHSEADPSKVAPGGLTKRDIELKLGSYNFTLGFLFGEKMLHIGPVFDLTINSIDVETVNSLGNKRTIEMDSYLGVNAGAMLILGNIANSGVFLTIKPYYSFGISSPDWKKLYDVTSTNYPSDDFESTKGGFGGFNINATLSLNIACF